MPEEAVVLAPYAAYGPMPWFVGRRPYCEARASVPAAPRPSAAAVKTLRSALRAFNAEPAPSPCATYGCCEYRGDGWASRWRRAPAHSARSGEAPAQWRAAKCDERRGDAKAAADDSGAVEHGRGANSENFVPRIIKPRKRKKKERKPSGADATGAAGVSSSPQLPAKADDAPVQSNGGLYLGRGLLEGLRLAAQSEQPALDLAPAAPSDAPDDEQPTEAVFCNCRYCDPQGVVWDVKEKRYSANLMRPGALSAGAYREAPPTDRLAAASQPNKLQVSSQIVTSLNGHRDIEIKFYSSSAES